MLARALLSLPFVLGTLSCSSSSDTATSPDALVGLGLQVVTAENAPLSAALSIQSTLPAKLTVSLEGEGVDLTLAFPETSTRHVVPLHGTRANRDIAVTVELTSDDGQTWSDTASFRTGALPDDLPFVDVVEVDEARVFSGWILLALTTQPTNRHWLVAVDPRDGEVAWLYAGPWNIGHAEVTAQNTMVTKPGDRVIEFDWFGEEVRHFSSTRNATQPEGSIPVDMFSTHHDVRMHDGVVAVLTNVTVEVPAYPTSYDDPETLGGPVEIEDNEVLLFAVEDGTVLERWALSERLDTTRIGFDALDVDPFGLDWVHANALMPFRGGWLVSSRHQDALISLDAEGDVRWILSNPFGWSAPYEPLVLQGIDVWPFHPHGPAEGADGTLYVFDNGNDGYSPYMPPTNEPERSRILAYSIDDVSRTAELAWSWAPQDPLFSNGLGNVAVLSNGDVLANFPLLSNQADASRGNLSVRVFEVTPGTPSGESVLDLRITSDRAADRDGVRAYRVNPIASFWDEGVQVIRR